MTTKPKTVMTLSVAAKFLGVPPDFLLALTLSGARRLSDHDGYTVEIAYEVIGDEVMFTVAGVERFRKLCPIAELIPAVKAAEQLGIHRSQISQLMYTGVPTVSGPVAKLPVWEIAGGEYIHRADLAAFAVHHKAAVERKAARDHAKKYANRGRKPAKAE